jgi:Family of unknown function (DUF6152)
MRAMRFRHTVLGGLALFATTAQAHHSLETTHDLKREVELHGKIIQVLMRNPHSILQINVMDKNGKLERVPLEFPKGLSALRKQGLNADTLKVGDEITITVNPLLTGRSGIAALKTLRRESDRFEWRDQKIKSH